MGVLGCEFWLRLGWKEILFLMSKDVDVVLSVRMYLRSAKRNGIRSGSFVDCMYIHIFAHRLNIVDVGFMFLVLFYLTFL